MANLDTYGIEDVTLSDLKRGYHISDGVRYEISYKILSVKQLAYNQLFKVPNSKGEITNTFSASSSARIYNRVWQKVARGYRGWSDKVPRGMAMIVPYDDPTGEYDLIPLTQKVLAFNVVDYSM
jgi:hypothetical protein